MRTSIKPLPSVGMTIGPASWDEAKLISILDAGVDWVRFPFSKETPDIHLCNHERLKRVADSLGVDVKSIGDLPGGKPRLSNNVPIEVKNTERWTIFLQGGIGAQTSVENHVLATSHSVRLPSGIDRLRFVIGDGENEFEVSESHARMVKGSFVHSGIIERKRAFLPTFASGTIETFTDLDLGYLPHLAKAQFDFVALSFVEMPSDLAELTAWLPKYTTWRPRIMSKIESSAGVENVQAIGEVSDAIMIGRGDLALQAGFESLWGLQDRAISACQRLGIPCLVATGFFESMVHTIIPQHSEFVDVATAYHQGCDGVMLSAPTTIGLDPLLAIKRVRAVFDLCNAEPSV